MRSLILPDLVPGQQWIRARKPGSVYQPGVGWVTWSDADAASYAIPPTDQGGGSVLISVPEDATDWQIALLASVGAPPTADDVVIDDGSIPPVTAAAPGARLVTITVTDDDADPIAGASVRLTGPTPAYASTDASGVALLSVDDGEYVLTVSKSGFSAIEPTALAIPATTAYTAALEPLILSPTSPDKALAVTTVIDSSGNPLSGKRISYQVIDIPSSATTGAYDRAVTQSAPSDADGLVTMEVLLGAVVRFVYDGGAPLVKHITSSPTYLPPMRGRQGV